MKPFTAVWPGRSLPRGAHWDGEGVNFAVFSEHAESVELCVFDPTGRMSGVLMKPQRKFLSNVAFGGPKLDTLYVTCTDSVYRRKTKAEGVLHFVAAEKK